MNAERQITRIPLMFISDRGTFSDSKNKKIMTCFLKKGKQELLRFIAY